MAAAMQARFASDVDFVSDRLKHSKMPSSHEHSVITLKFATRQDWSGFLRKVAVTSDTAWELAAPYLHVEQFSDMRALKKAVKQREWLFRKLPPYVRHHLRTTHITAVISIELTGLGGCVFLRSDPQDVQSVPAEMLRHITRLDTEFLDSMLQDTSTHRTAFGLDFGRSEMVMITQSTKFVSSHLQMLRQLVKPTFIRRDRWQRALQEYMRYLSFLIVNLTSRSLKKVLRDRFSHCDGEPPGFVFVLTSKGRTDSFDTFLPQEAFAQRQLDVKPDVLYIIPVKCCIICKIRTTSKCVCGTRYCSREHQLLDRARHKHDCGDILTARQCLGFDVPLAVCDKTQFPQNSMYVSDASEMLCSLSLDEEKTSSSA